MKFQNGREKNPKTFQREKAVYKERMKIKIKNTIRTINSNTGS